MTVEVKAEATHVGEAVDSLKEEALKVEQVEEAKPKIVEKCSSYREESNFLSDLKEHERKALNELKSKLQEGILGNTLFKKEETERNARSAKEGQDKEKSNVEDKEDAEGEKFAQEAAEKKDESKPEDGDRVKAARQDEQETKHDDESVKSVKNEEGEEEKKPDSGEKEKGVEVDKDITLWGVPLLPSRGAVGTDVVLLKFLRAREFKVNEAFQMLKKTLQWRKKQKVDLILDEDFGSDLNSAAYMAGVDREGHPICYNIFGVLDNEEMYQKTFGTGEKREQFLRWRFQLMEKGVKKLDLKPGGINSLLQINDLKNSPGPSKKEVRVAIKQAVGLLQDNYPEFVARNIFINVPFWYYAVHALLSPFLTQRTKSKFVIAHPAKVTETLFKYIPIEEIPVQYGGLKRDNDFEFSGENGVASELLLKPGSTAIIEIPTPEVGATSIWDLTVLGWEVSYKEEFVPTDEVSYTVIVRKGKKIATNEGPVRNTFRTNEPGKIVLTIENSSNKKKKAFYRYKNKKSGF